ncbi:type II toxin-antitoxin system VapC family toxin [Aurantimonas sp. VKM B-3413]|uniref:type II toxin-antitoxin system VapC family toxin n=1 Tax=Aurantimonas sp. VKM B-3413 TaxID=2779401 RepID=UPI001E3A0447|nr:type II toxin-antitoxin system VapC family toxin [Aurantimonas sp. VKM B-3413]MCB8839633.1 type II toxin-antitoxin system VapC family toxin [Aurantimonas sp. VKM B-3413]
MVVDTSALLAILQREPEREGFLAAMAMASRRLISTASAVETSMVVLSRSGEEGLRILDGLFGGLQIEKIPVTEDQVAMAVDAFRRFGKGRHAAALNFGDCFSYALAKATGEPLLFKGDDFSRTDLLPADSKS